MTHQFTSPIFGPRCLALIAAFGLLPALSAQSQRAPDEDVNSAAVRTRPALQPSESLLHNGWGVTPAGRPVRVSDMPLKMIVSPDKRMLVAMSAGFNDTGVTLLDLKTKEVAQFLPLKACFNGLAFSLDGTQLFACGGSTGDIFVFTYRDGHATPAPSVRPAPGANPVFLAGIAVHPQ